MRYGLTHQMRLAIVGDRTFRLVRLFRPVANSSCNYFQKIQNCMMMRVHNNVTGRRTDDLT